MSNVLKARNASPIRFRAEAMSPSQRSTLAQPPQRIRLAALVYAHEWLEKSGEAQATAARHSLPARKNARSAGRGLTGPEQADWLLRLENERDNVRAAAGLALAAGVASAPRSPRARAIMLRHGACSRGASNCGASSAVPSTVADGLEHSVPVHRAGVSQCAVTNVVRRLRDMVEARLDAAAPWG